MVLFLCDSFPSPQDSCFCSLWMSLLVYSLRVRWDSLRLIGVQVLQNNTKGNNTFHRLKDCLVKIENIFYIHSRSYYRSYFYFFTCNLSGLAGDLTTEGQEIFQTCYGNDFLNTCRNEYFISLFI